jgi:mono/diheme cytochrome c family protein
MISKIPMFLLLLAAGCAESVVDSTPVAGRWYSEQQVAAGGPLYQAHCAVCHAADGSATADWRTPDANGNYPPPPLNGTAHTWHHPLEVLDDTIVNGGVQFGGVMPGFGTALNEGQRLAIIAWIQSLWSDEIYSRWQEIESRNHE